MYTYQPFGDDFTSELEEQVTNNFKFTGQWYDSEISQYYLRARDYYPAIYRFTSRDPVKGKFKEPLTLHVYLYCANDPLNRIDPSGNFFTYIGQLFTHGWGARLRAASCSMGLRAWAFAGKVYAAAYVKAAKVTMAIYGISYGGGRAVDANKIHHIFGKTSHNLGPLVDLFGSPANAFQVVEAAFIKAVTSGVYTGQNLQEGVVVMVEGIYVVVSGTIVNGVPQVGTFYIP